MQYQPEMKSAIALLLLAAACSAAPSVRHRPLGRRPGGRIISGDLVDVSQHPYMVSLQYLNKHACGGSIISSSYVLTAAHCIYGVSWSYFSVRAGSSTRESGGTVYEASGVFWHSGFNLATGEYDIGFVGFSDPISFQAVSLATSELEAGSSATVTGWGSVASGEDASEQLRAVTVSIVARSTCREKLGSGITENVVCAGDADGDNVACDGDDGGPLVVGSTQYGVVSWGRGCGVPGYPGAYTNVAALHDWITAATGVF
ncbi:trypsin-3-like [Schistocerca serialis cubense]|uniref:trypsin-3-like n=1 Tax=Schistocerca serialis cubense TaxID=2023355 RepID=UPI00214EF9C7|nr:trypsin-3-like [Schistocerca serialis cubense]